MGVPNSRASILSLVSLKRPPKKETIQSGLQFRRPKSSYHPCLFANRSILTSSLNHPTSPFFEICPNPSSPAESTSNHSIKLGNLNKSPKTYQHQSSPSHSPHPPQPGHHPRSHHSHTESQTPPTSLIASNSTKPEAHDHLQTRSLGSNLVHSQLKPFNFHPHSISPQPIQISSNPRLLLPKKTFFVFRNGASGIPKTVHSPCHSTQTHQGRGRPVGGGGNPNDKGKLKGISAGRDPHAPLGLDQHRSIAMDQSESCSVRVGEDSYFLRTDSLGVADGVGGWSGKPGANAGLFSSKLMHYCSTELSRYEDVNDVKFLSYSQIDPVDILQYAFDRSIHELKTEGIVGSTTALIAILRNDELRIANIGDCCCSVIRGNDYIFRSEEQQHSFNYPVQIGTNSKSTPLQDAQSYNIKVKKDDIVILSSDGLVDNLFDEDILEEVLKYTTTNSMSSSPSSDDQHRIKRFLPELVSESLCLKAKTVIEDQQAITSPFAQRANEEGIHYVGGKNDDISVLVAIVGDQSD